ncbi:hypothetical protein BDZ89DRAFT_1048197 [Hymenopellis radicata]|nr:hypothetical protein BDZ89DRAFT_1048197 [Hymenopellis radicata]
MASRTCMPPLEANNLSAFVAVAWSKLPPLSHIYTPGGYPEGSYDMLATVFERSLPLSFEYDMDPLMNDIASGVFVDIVKRHSLRWRDIVISGTPKSYMSLGEVGELPLLETASLDVWDFKALQPGPSHKSWTSFDMRQSCDPLNCMASTREERSPGSSQPSCHHLIQTFKLEVTEATGDLVDLAASATPLLLSQMIHFECTITYCLDLVQFLRSLTLMIQSRWHIDRREVARLQSVRLSIGHSYNAEEELCRMIGCLRMLRAEGLTVVVFRDAMIIVPVYLEGKVRVERSLAGEDALANVSIQKTASENPPAVHSGYKMASVQTNVIQVEFRTEGVEQVLFISGTPVLAFPHPPELGQRITRKRAGLLIETAFALDGHCGGNSLGRFCWKFLVTPPSRASIVQRCSIRMAACAGDLDRSCMPGRSFNTSEDMLPPIDVSGLHHVRIMVRDRDNRTPDRLAMGVDLVRRCPQLRTFSLAETHQFPSSWNPPSVSAAAHITSSHLIDLSTSDLSLIYYLRLPNLQTLTVCLPFLHGSPTGSPTLHGLEAIRALLKNSRHFIQSCLVLRGIVHVENLRRHYGGLLGALPTPGGGCDSEEEASWCFLEWRVSGCRTTRDRAGLSNVWRGELSENDELELEEEEDEDDEDEEDEDLPFLHLPVLQSFRLAVPGARFYNFVAPGARGLHDYQAVQVVMGSTFLRMAEARGGRGCTLCLNVGGEVALLTVEDENALRGAVEDGLDIAILRGGLRK